MGPPLLRREERIASFQNPPASGRLSVVAMPPGTSCLCCPLTFTPQQRSFVFVFALYPQGVFAQDHMSLTPASGYNRSLHFHC